MDETVKILGCHFSYNKTLQQEKKFKKYISKIETSNFRRENKCFQISVCFKDYTSYNSNSHFYRHYKSFEHDTKKISLEK